MPEHHTKDLESSLLRSPKASEGSGGALGEKEALKRGNTVGVRDQVLDLMAEQGARVSRAERNSTLPTPKARDSQPEGYEAGLRRPQPQIGTVVKAIVDGDDRLFMPTPTSRDHKDGQAAHVRDGKVQTDTLGRLLINGNDNLLGTPRTSSANGSTEKQVQSGAPKARLEDQVHTNWGRFEAAIKRWEMLIDRPAPAPTKPDGKDGNHRLSSKFTEWMMGLPDGWITDVGLSRTDELKACGNGVVPQQAFLALETLLGGKEEPITVKQSNLPTPTPSDSYIGNLKSNQTKPGSMHSVNLPKAAEMIRREEI